MVDRDLDGIDDSVDDVVNVVPIELGPIPNCVKCNDTGAVAKRMHENDNGEVIIDEYKDCSCGIAIRQREEAKKEKRD